MRKRRERLLFRRLPLRSDTPRLEDLPSGGGRDDLGEGVDKSESEYQVNVALALAAIDHDPVEAKAFARRALRLEIKSTEALRLLRQSYARIHEQGLLPSEEVALLEEEKETFNRLLQVEADLAVALLGAGSAQRRLAELVAPSHTAYADLSKAVVQLERCGTLLRTATEPTVADEQQLGEVYLELGRLYRMLAKLRAVEDPPASDEEPRPEPAVILQQALDQYRQVPAVHAAYIDASREAALTYVLLEKESEATNLLSHHIEQAENDSERSRLAVVLAERQMKSNRLADAAASLQQALQWDPASPAAWMLLAEVYAKQGRAQEAIDACKRGAGAEQYLVTAHLWLGQFAQQEDDAAAASEHYARLLSVPLEKAVLIHPEPSRNARRNEIYRAAATRLAQYRLDRQDTIAHCLAALDQVQRFGELSPSLRERFTNLLSQADEKGEAIGPAVAHRIGQLYANSRQYRPARMWLARALASADPFAEREAAELLLAKIQQEGG